MAARSRLGLPGTPPKGVPVLLCVRALTVDPPSLPSPPLPSPWNRAPLGGFLRRRPSGGLFDVGTHRLPSAWLPEDEAADARHDRPPSTTAASDARSSWSVPALSLRTEDNARVVEVRPLHSTAVTSPPSRGTLAQPPGALRLSTFGRCGRFSAMVAAGRLAAAVTTAVVVGADGAQ
jgi:hypothetical protein